MMQTQLHNAMLRLSHKVQTALVVLASSLFLVGCAIEPPLELVDRENNGNVELNKVSLDLQVLWSYDLTYDWQAEWYYSWDNRDDDIFGTWEVIEPDVFNIRRYFTGEDPKAPHTSILADVVSGNRFEARYKYGYYDILVWNDVNTLDGVQSLHFDETSSLEYVTAYTNQSSQPSHAPQRAYSQNFVPGLAFYQPEFLFAGNYEDLHVSDDPADYDSLIVETNTWYKYVPLLLEPVTYIYLPQIILHHNNNKITDIDGSGVLSGMARSVNLLTHITSDQDISVAHSLRMKKHLPYVPTKKELEAMDAVPEDVDIIGGRAMTFGLTGVNPYKITRANPSYAQVQRSEVKNFLEVKMHFNNGADSTFVWDVTDQVKERYKGGVITIHLDCDTVTVPKVGGSGSGFDATVMDPEEEIHEIEMSQKRKRK